MNKPVKPTKNPYNKNSVQAKTWSKGYEYGLKNEKNKSHTQCPVGFEDYQIVWDQGFVAGRQDQKQIPEGMYCYKIKGQSVDAKGKIVLNTNRCPFYGRRNDKKEPNSNGLAFCTLTRVVDDILLDDQCKVCGIKNDDEGTHPETN